MDKLLIKNVHIIDPSQSLNCISDIMIEDGVISKLGKNLTVDCKTIDGSGLYAAPGLVDMHVHLRDPGFTDKEDIMTGCKSAAAGGVTSLLAMPNTKPAVDTPETVKYILDKAKNADARVYVVGAITKGLKSEEMTDIPALKEAGIIALSDDGRPVVNTKFMAEAMQLADELGLTVTAHCEDLFLADGGKINEGKVSKLLGIKGIPAAAEDTGTAREIAIAAAYGTAIHICHVSTATSVALVRDAKARGVRVTAETCPHYFTFTENELLKRDADFRMNPPLRTETDRQAIIDGLLDGTLDAISTDHAPHTPEEKADFEKSPNGSIGMETSFSASYTALVSTGIMSLEKLIKLMSTTPAEILGINAGSLTVGSPADIMLFDSDEEWVVDENKLHGKSKNTPFKGKTLKSRVKYTICGGRIIYTAE